jgi:hypothetical protein
MRMSLALPHCQGRNEGKPPSGAVDAVEDKVAILAIVVRVTNCPPREEK